ncbi:MAG: (2Fe-2S)-binding protein [Planctomycetota bacterium]|jgi:bacterioferritin-associated ferredoxin|nr:MAG: (2Fe-2S)-binding protein [Planctomycetota bacterium]
MELDDEVCLCFHVSKRKLLSYMRINKSRMRRASQLSECGGAGTGCGWCVGYLKRLFAQMNPEAATAEAALAAEPTPEEHRTGRASYLKQKEEG